MSSQFDPLTILEILNRCDVEYVIVGGFAAVSYGSPLPTADVDVTPRPSPENLARLSNALRELDARVRVEGVPGGLPFAHNAASLADATVLKLTTRAGDLDLVNSPAGIQSYAQLAEASLVVQVHGVDVRLASLDDVIASKEAADRPKDRAALPILRRLRERQDDQH
jgi:hypothetical protein